MRSLRGLSCLSFSRDEKLDSEKRVDRAKRLERVELLERLERHVLERCSVRTVILQKLGSISVPFFGTILVL